MEIRYLNKKKRLNGAAGSTSVTTIDEQLIDNFQYNRIKANEFHEGGKPFYFKISPNKF
jgi:hypothetical protein